MASRILYNNGLEIDLAISGAYQNIIQRGSGFVRDTGVQNISGQKFFYDTVTFYSGLNVSGDFVPSGSVAGNLSPKVNNIYDLGSSSTQWRNLYVGSNARINTLYVGSNATVTGNLGVTGNSLLTGSLGVAGTTTLLGDFIPTNVAVTFLPKTTNLYDLGSNSQQFRNLWVGSTGRINNLHVNGDSSITGNETVTGTLTVNGLTTVKQLVASSVSATGGYGNISGSNLTTTGATTLGVTNPVSLASTGSISSTNSGVFRLLYITGSGIPTSSTGIGAFGQIVLGSGYLYACTGANLWGRTLLSTW